MITKNKLLSLKETTRLRKIAQILQENSHYAYDGKPVDLAYLNSISSLAELEPIDSNLSGKQLCFALEDRAQILLCKLGAEPSDWDFTDENGNLDKSKRIIQNKILIIDRIRSPYNVGAVFRSADSFGIKQIILIEGSASPEHAHARRTCRGCIDTVDWTFMTEDEAVSFIKQAGLPVIALETGGENINTFDFPPEGIAILGSEEFGVSPKLMGLCTNRISIPMAGTKGSLNVSVCCGILLNQWWFKTRNNPA